MFKLSTYYSGYSGHARLHSGRQAGDKVIFYLVESCFIEFLIKILKMKIKSFLFFLFVATLGSSLFFSCAKQNTPSSQAKEFLDVMSKGDFEQAKVMVDEDSENVIVSLEKAKKSVEGKASDITIISEKHKGDVATVKYKYGDSNKVNEIELTNVEGEEWKVVMDRRSKDIAVGEESVGEILNEVDLSIEEVLSLSGDAIEAAMDLAGKTLEGLGKILQNKSGDIKLKLEGSEEDIQEAKDGLIEALREMKIDFEGSEKDIEKAKEDIKDVIKEMKDKFEGSEDDIEKAKREIEAALKELEQAFREN